MACGGRDFEVEVEVVKEEPPDEQWIKAEVDIEEQDLLQHPRVRAALPHLALGGGLPAPAENQVPPAESSVNAGTEAFPDTRQAAPEREDKLEPESLPGEGCNKVTVTEEDAYVAGRWFNSRLVLVDCGAALRHSDRYCAECGRLCSSRSALLRHQQAYCAPECDDAPRPPEGAGDKAARRYECDICHYTTKIRTNIVRHLRTHTGEKPFKCNLCGYRSFVRSHLTNHMRTHTGEKPFKCSVCEYRSYLRGNLSSHMRTHTGEKSNLCDYMGITRTCLTQHMQKQTGEKRHNRREPFKCNFCDFINVKRSKLTIHMRTHTGEKPFKCSVCEYRCNQKGTLSSHMRTHTGEKPFKCNLCDYRSVVRSHLTNHMRTHTGEKPFECSVCEYRFNIRSNLSRHMRTHMGEKPVK